MATDLNRCEFIGRLGQEVDVRYMPNGDPVVNFSIAVNHSKKDVDGNYIDNVDWIKVVAFGKLAKTCSDWLKKGQQVYVAGRLSNKKWEKDGVTHYSNDLVCDFMQMLGGKPDVADNSPMIVRKAAAPPVVKQTVTNIADIDDDSLPF